jgi:hypothetical protein
MFKARKFTCQRTHKTTCKASFIQVVKNLANFIEKNHLPYFLGRECQQCKCCIPNPLISWLHKSVFHFLLTIYRWGHLMSFDDLLGSLGT